MTDDEIEALSKTYLRYILEAEQGDRIMLLASYGREVERRTRHRAYAVAMEAVNRIDDRTYQPR